MGWQDDPVISSSSGAAPWESDPVIDRRKPVVMRKLPTMRESIAEELKTRAPGVGFLAGAGSALDDAAYRLKQLFGGKLDSQETARVQANRDLVSASGEALAGNITGNMAMTAVPAAGLYGGATNLAARFLPAAVAPLVGGAASGAAVAGATQPVLQGESAGNNMLVGAAGGAAGDALSRGVARVAQPIMQSPAVQTLLRHDVVPTPGQAVGPDSFYGKLEQKAQSMLGIGDVITAARGRAGKEFNRAAINQAVPQGQAAIKTVGNEGITELAQATSDNFAKLLSGKSVRPDPSLFSSLSVVKNGGTLPLNAQGSKDYDGIIKSIVRQRIPANGVLQADSLKAEIIGDLGKEAQEYLKSSVRAERAVGEALMRAKDTLQQWMLRNAGVSAADAAAADVAYTAKVAVGKAAKSAQARGGEFSPLQLLRKANPGSATERLATAGQAVLPGVTPNSGTVDRAMLAAMLAGGVGAGANEYFGGPGYLTALGLAPLLMSRGASRYAVGDLAPRLQGPISSALRSTAPYAANAGTLAALLEQRNQ